MCGICFLHINKNILKKSNSRAWMDPGLDQVEAPNLNTEQAIAQEKAPGQGSWEEMGLWVTGFGEEGAGLQNPQQ